MKSWNQMIKAAENRNKPETAERLRGERDMAYIDDVHGYYKEIARLLAARDYGRAFAAMQSASARLAVMAVALGLVEKI